MRRAVKRLVDIVVALLGLILLSPVMAVVALLIRLRMGKPVLFKQNRPGLQGLPFDLYKFRTMTDDAMCDGREVDDADRLTSLGRKLRKFSLDELPQLWSVLKGEMSLVGPRPLLMGYSHLYNLEQARRHEVKPGITGWAQVNGRNDTTWEERLKLDVWYVDHRSLWLDSKILAITLVKVLSGKGVSQEGQETMDRFRGSE